MKKIAVLGWYNKLNYGDELIRNSINRLFGEHFLVFFGFPPSNKCLKQFDMVIIGGGSVWDGYANWYTKCGKRINKPVGVLGVSSNGSLDKHESEILVRRAEVIVIRDSLTQRYLVKDPKVVVAPDLTWLYPIEKQETPPSKIKVGVNLRGWSEEVWSPSEVVEIIREFSHSIIPFSFYYGESVWEQGKAVPDSEVMSRGGIDSNSTPNMERLNECRIFIGMRFHSLVLAAQACIPFVGFSYHPKIVSLCESMGLSEYCVPLGNKDELREAIWRLEENYDTVREILKEQRELNIQKAQREYNLAKNNLEECFSCDRSFHNQMLKLIKGGTPW